MRGYFIVKLLAWGIAVAVVALPIVGVLNGWFASDRWPIGKINVRAEFNHVSAEQIRAAVQPLLGQGFFAIKLHDIREAVAKLPWIEHAEARKRWPDAIELVVREQQPYARWGDKRLVNRSGGLFTIAGGDGLQGLPRLAGPDDRLDDVLRFYAESVKEFSGSGLVIDAVTLSQRGGWKLDLASGAVIEVGREDAKKRLRRFLDVWPRLVGGNPGPPAYIDLRYENGFALRWAPPAPPPGEEMGPPMAQMAAGNRESRIGNGSERPAGDSQAALGDSVRRHAQSGLLAIADSPFAINHSWLAQIPEEFRQPMAGHPESRIPAFP